MKVSVTRDAYGGRVGLVPPTALGDIGRWALPRELRAALAEVGDYRVRRVARGGIAVRLLPGPRPGTAREVRGRLRLCLRRDAQAPGPSAVQEAEDGARRGSAA